VEALQLIEAWPGANLLRQNWIAYLLVNAAHILGLGLIAGAILPLDARLLGLFRQTPLTVIGPFMIRVAMTGVALAVVTGAWLFSVDPDGYLSNAAFLWKIGLLAAALANVALQHLDPGFRAALAGGPVTGRVKAAAASSAALWLAVLVAGRWIGFE
jgi:hypothetical protein